MDNIDTEWGSTSSVWGGGDTCELSFWKNFPVIFLLVNTYGPTKSYLWFLPPLQFYDFMIWYIRANFPETDPRKRESEKLSQSEGTERNNIYQDEFRMLHNNSK